MKRPDLGELGTRAEAAALGFDTVTPADVLALVHYAREQRRKSAEDLATYARFREEMHKTIRSLNQEITEFAKWGGRVWPLLPPEHRKFAREELAKLIMGDELENL